MFTVSTLLFLVFVNSVTSNVEDKFSHKILIPEGYRHNPPSFEPYNVPDASGFEVRKSRSVEIEENINNEQLGVVETISNSDSVLNSWSTEHYAEAEKLQSDNKSQVNNASSNVKRRKLRRNQRHPSNEANDAVTEALPYLNDPASRSSVSIEPVSTSPSPRTVVPKTFTKRPVQFNPVKKRTWENTRTPVVKILEETNYVYAHNGNFHYSFEGADGTKVSSVGELKSFNDESAGEAVAGEVHYKDNEGNDFSLSYTADENGYRPYGAHLPTPPPIPPAIARALKHLATKSTPETITEATNYYY